jgi:hypothetical protein
MVHIYFSFYFRRLDEFEDPYSIDMDTSGIKRKDRVGTVTLSLR